MGKHSRPGPPNQPSRSTPAINPSDQLAPYERRRRPPMEEARRQRPLHGGGGHVQPDQPRVLLEWDGFAYQVVGTAADLATASAWVHQADHNGSDTET